MGFAKDPNDHSKAYVINTSSKEEANYQQDMVTNTQDYIGKSVYSLGNKTQKKLKIGLKKRRKKFGDPGKGNFMGPWAGYSGEKEKGENELTKE